ncbi:DLW-39 family protein [Glutamicibacter sp. MNS18]|nr:DLW-39 family protein [Glutamicibacter sp. MNS18]MCW4466640.1 DLW-39 family protein [Glutamicibacter sp. MNS18]
MKKLLILGSIAAAAVVLIKKAKGSAETKETWQQVTDEVS